MGELISLFTGLVQRNVIVLSDAVKEAIGLILYYLCSFVNANWLLSAGCEGKEGDTIFIGQYLFTGSETTVLLEVS